MDGKSQQLLNEQLDIFLKNISNAQLYASAVKRNKNKMAKELTLRKKSVEIINETENLDPLIKEYNGIDFKQFSFMSPYTGTKQVFAFKRTTIDEHLNNLTVYQNRQYQWILVEVYEFFEDYIEWVYACIGFIRNSFWIGSDFGDISISEIKNKDLNWFHSKSVSKKKAPHSILERFRHVVPNVSHIEIYNRNNTNYRLAITLVEHFRHIIVHYGGNFKNKDEFIKTVLNKANIGNNTREAALSYINQFTGAIDDMDTILLLDAPLMGGVMFFERLNKLIEAIVSYAFLLNKELTAYLEQDALQP